MKGRARHTTPPYSVDLEPLTGGGARVCAVKDGQAVTVAFTTETNHDKNGPREGFVGTAEAIENAKFLARAGNCHEDLVDALEATYEALKDHLLVQPNPLFREAGKALVGKIRAALVKAGVST